MTILYSLSENVLKFDLQIPIAVMILKVSYKQSLTLNSALKADPYISIFLGTHPRSTQLHKVSTSKVIIHGLHLPKNQTQVPPRTYNLNKSSKLLHHASNVFTKHSKLKSSQVQIKPTSGKGSTEIFTWSPEGPNRLTPKGPIK